MEGLVERILSVRKEISDLNREKGAIQSKIDKKKILLEDLEKLTVNQLDMFEKNGKETTL